MRAALIASLALSGLALAAPARAEETVTLGADFVDKLVADCKEFSADPKGVAQKGPLGPSRYSMISADGGMVAINGTTEEDGQYVTAFMTSVDLPQGRTVACARSTYFGNLTGTTVETEPLYDALAARADEILGGKTIAVGGPFYMKGQTGRLGYWAREGLPPKASIFLTLMPSAASVSVLRTYAPDDIPAPGGNGGN